METFLVIYRKHHVKFVWVKGHADVPENERCDQLAVQAYKRPDLQIDYFYEEEQNSSFQLFSQWTENISFFSFVKYFNYIHLQGFMWCITCIY